jgi:hypothetical protein
MCLEILKSFGSAGATRKEICQAMFNRRIPGRIYDVKKDRGWYSDLFSQKTYRYYLCGVLFEADNMNTGFIPRMCNKINGRWVLRG